MLKPSLIFLLLLVSTITIQSQDFPNEMKLTEDGTRLTLGSHKTTGFYDESHMPIIKIYFPDDEFIGTLISENEDILAEVEIDGVRFDSVGVRIKGLTSRGVEKDKYSFNISLDEFKNQDYKSYETLNLNNGFEDPSFVREILYNHIGREYSPCPKTNYAQLYINDEYWGPYTNVQQLDGNFIRDWFLSNDGTRWRAINKEWSNNSPFFGPDSPNFDPNDSLIDWTLDTIFAEGPLDTIWEEAIDTFVNDPNFDPSNDPNFSFFGEGKSSLNFLGDVNEYEEHYLLKKTKKDNPWEDLALGTEKLNTLPIDSNFFDNLKGYLDIDKALWFIAHENVFTDTDGYLYKGGMDYYVYWEAETGRLIPLEYDGNSILPTDEFADEMDWTPFYREDDIRFPLVHRLLQSPEIRQRYLAHYKTILKNYFNPEFLNPLIDNYAHQLRESISSDTKRNYEPIEFESDLIKLKALIKSRRNYLTTLPEISQAGVNIDSLSKVTVSPIANQAVEIQSRLTGDIPIKSMRLYYAKGLVGPFDRIKMTEVSPGIFSASIPGFEAGQFVRYYVEAISDTESEIRTFYPEGAEHDVFAYRVNSIETEGAVVINEILASNNNGVTDQDGEFEDWIELYNTSSEDVDLSGYLLSDNFQELDKYKIPEGTLIAANDYLIIWADDDEEQNGLHSNFKLSSSSGEAVYLSNRNANIIDEVVFDALDPNISYSRKPNGTGGFEKTEPTFRSNNDFGTSSVNTAIFNKSIVNIYPNPSTGHIQISYQDSKQSKFDVQIFDNIGILIYQQKGLHSKVNLDLTGQLKDGLYFVRVNSLTNKILVFTGK